MNGSEIECQRSFQSDQKRLERNFGGFSFYAIMLSLLWLTGCVDTINIDLPQESFGRLVIDGSVNRSATDYVFQVGVSTTQPLDEFTKGEVGTVYIELIMNEVTVLSLDNEQTLKMSIDNFHSRYGGSRENARFKIRVTENGNVYESEEQQIIESPLPGELSVNIIERSEINDVGNIVEREYIELLIGGDIMNAKGKRVSFKWEVSGNYQFNEIDLTPPSPRFPRVCYVEAPLRTNEINLLLSDQVSSQTFKDVKIDENLLDYKYQSGYYYTVVQRTLNEDAALYYDEIRSGVDREGTIFDVPPGRTTTNIRNIEGDREVLGYFIGASVDTIRTKISPSESGFQRHLCAFITLEPPCNSTCCDCLTIINSSLDKPPYWK